jgi:hypothetical protein
MWKTRFVLLIQASRTQMSHIDTSVLNVKGKSILELAM